MSKVIAMCLWVAGILCGLHLWQPTEQNLMALAYTLAIVIAVGGLGAFTIWAFKE